MKWGLQSGTKMVEPSDMGTKHLLTLFCTPEPKDEFDGMRCSIQRKLKNLPSP